MHPPPLLRFEVNDLPPYAEPIELSELRVGEIYYFVHFLDDNMRVPSLEPVVYIGRDLEPADSGRVYFQDAPSHLGGVPYDSTSGEPCSIYSGSENEIGHVFDFEHALNCLLLCSSRCSRDRA